MKEAHDSFDEGVSVVLAEPVQLEPHGLALGEVLANELLVVHYHLAFVRSVGEPVFGSQQVCVCLSICFRIFRFITTDELI